MQVIAPIKQEKKIEQIRAHYQKRRAQSIQSLDLSSEKRFLVNWQKLHDQTLTRLWNLLLAPSQANNKDFLLLATGGYGRGELYPQSDLDILIVLPSQESSLTPTQQNAIELWVQTVWDLGMNLSHRLITETQLHHEWSNLSDETAEPVVFRTSLLETRCLSQNNSRWEQLRTELNQSFDPIAFFYAKRHEQQQRHNRYNETPFNLEPNCKESPGGLRDAHVLSWLQRSAALQKNQPENQTIPTQEPALISDLLGAMQLSAQEILSLRRSVRFLQRVRIALHTVRERKDDRLSFDIQQALALRLGFTNTNSSFKSEGQQGGKERATRHTSLVGEVRSDTANTDARLSWNWSASEQLMQSYYRAARQIYQINSMVLQSVQEFLKRQTKPQATDNLHMIDDHFAHHNGYLIFRNPSDLHTQPELLLRAFVHLCQHPDVVQLSVHTLRALWNAKHLINTAFRHEAKHRALFIQILSGPKGIVRALRLMHQTGLLGCYLPVFRRVEGLMQHDLFHVYTVDQHSLTVVRHLRRLTMDAHRHEFPIFSARMRQIDDRLSLYVAALFHDIAKGRGGDHSELGAREARAFCQQHALTDEQTERVVFLVRHHLLMSKTAQHQDINNPQVLSHFCAQFRSKDDLLYLYLLTFADMRATAPNIWTAWKAQLLEQLYQRALAVFDQDHQDDESRLLNAVAQQCPNLKPEQISQFWKYMGEGYLLQHPSDTLAWHAQQILSAETTHSPLCEIRAIGPADFELFIYLKDAPYLLLRLLWVLQQYGCLVQQAQIHTSESGQVLDHLHVNVPTLIAEQRAAWMAHLRAQLIETLQTNPETAAVLTQLPSASLGRLSARARHFPIATQVKFFFDSTGHYCVMSLICRDRLGLLYAIARELAHLGISLHQAKINTLGQRVEDVFILDAAPFKQHAQLEAQLEQAIFNLNI
jgi:[protein-PII] uridylyltransferase